MLHVNALGRRDNLYDVVHIRAQFDALISQTFRENHAVSRCHDPAHRRTRHRRHDEESCDGRSPCYAAGAWESPGESKCESHVRRHRE
jgi:hypothetical protein